MRVFLQFVLVLIILPLLLCGCRKQQSDVITLRLLMWVDAKSTKVLDESLDKFEARHPGVKVVREYSTFTRFRDKLLSEVGGGKSLDVARSSSLFFPLCADVGLYQR